MNDTTDQSKNERALLANAPLFYGGKARRNPFMLRTVVIVLALTFALPQLAAAEEYDSQKAGHPLR